MIESPVVDLRSRIPDVPEPPAGTSLRVLVVSSVFPSAAHPTYGVFVKERVRAVANLPGVDLRVVAPTPFVPPLKSLRRRYVWWEFPAEEVMGGLRIVRPRFPMLPKIGGYFSSELMYPGLVRAVDRIRREFEFDLIDAHFAYPSGVAAERLGRRYGVPVVITGRGEDMHRFPSLPLIGRKIRRALARGAHCIALSEEIERTFLRNGADERRVTRIPNGIDAAAFRLISRDEARRNLGLPLDRPIILSVGNLQELKGFHLLVDSLVEVRRRFPDVLLILVGDAAPYGENHRAAIVERIRAGALADHVRLVGRRPHRELNEWYGAADVFALLSSREGSPNVLLEALACGTPAVATPVGGIPEELSDPLLGILLPERSAAAAAVGLSDALGRTWDHREIHARMQQRSWSRVAEQVLDVFERAVGTKTARARNEPPYVTDGAARPMGVTHVGR
ncbi:MAG: glycosyltransferase [Planctomycetaceae bacterium]